MVNSVRVFYDELAESYHLIFADWPGSMRRQAAALDRLIGSALGAGPHTILDGACGIGTQAIGLALLGHQVHATDISSKAVARAEREATARNALLTFGVADLRSLASTVDGEFDVVVACDNALPHLLSDDDLQLAIDNMAAKLRPDGLFLASIRDYDRLVQERPQGEGPRVFDDIRGRRIAFQVWDWSDDGSRYSLHQFIVRQEGAGWQTEHFRTEYRALLPGELVTALRHAGFALAGIHWHEPEESGYFQPIVTARRSRESTVDSRQL
ncbi:MAG: class I SAM-dependent methyltransferase [Chloroflexota bacterium]|nr:class I SAM-dependent methyltransferase [Chloroflexia bacterium]MDQ3226624.1 class I SAM-dependent methyltransferase [Chloroflexota bacterium]